MNANSDPALLAASLIRRSITHSEIVTVEHDEALAFELQLAAAGEVLADEFWGEAAGGLRWRVHLRTRSRP